MSLIDRLIVTSLCLVLFTHCHAPQDGPPSRFFDASQLNEPIPHHEPLSAYGNPESYHVMGQTYHVQKNNFPKTQKGVASWYGTKFHGHLTSNHERYNMNALTAAHKTLPLPTYVRVTRQDTGQSIIVRVNDRGPFVSNRIIDLSYAAAQKLDMLKYGTAPVQLTVLAAPTQTTQWIQTGAFSNATLAQHFKQHLAKALNTSISIQHDTTLYRVRLGPYTNRQAAQAAIQSLEARSIKWYWTTT